MCACSRHHNCRVRALSQALVFCVKWADGCKAQRTAWRALALQLGGTVRVGFYDPEEAGFGVANKYKVTSYAAAPSVANDYYSIRPVLLARLSRNTAI